MTKPRKLAVGIGAAALVCSGLALRTSGPVAWFLTWAAVSCAISSTAYVVNRPSVYGKRAGRLIWWRALPTAVFIGAFRVACALMRSWRRYPTKSEVSPGVWVAGRLAAHELLKDVDYVIDLVSEFPERRALREHPGYRFLPVLDGGVPPDMEPVLRLLDELADPSTTVVVHCDSGMGRAPTIAALLLVRRGHARDIADAIARVENARPFVHLGTADREFLARVEPMLRRPAILPTAAATERAYA